MADDVQQLVNDILDEGAFDATDVQALRWLDRRHKQMCGRAQVYVADRAISLFSGAPDNYVTAQVPEGLVEAYKVEVFPTSTSSSIIYTRARTADLPAIRAGTLTLSGPGGVFVPTPGAEPLALDERYLALYPKFDIPVFTSSVTGAYVPPDLTATPSAEGILRIDDDAVEGLLAGVFATALSRPNEGRLDLAATYEAQFAAACEELRLRQRRRLRGTGPGQIRLVGFDA